jgi:hypothetical protein
MLKTTHARQPSARTIKQPNNQPPADSDQAEAKASGHDCCLGFVTSRPICSPRGEAASFTRVELLASAHPEVRQSAARFEPFVFGGTTFTPVIGPPRLRFQAPAPRPASLVTRLARAAERGLSRPPVRGTLTGAAFALACLGVAWCLVAILDSMAPRVFATDHCDHSAEVCK